MRPALLVGEHQVARLDVAMHHARLVGVLQAERRLVDERAGVADRQRPLGLDHAGQVEALDVLHGEDKACAGAEGGIGGDDVGMLEPGDDADLAEKSVEHVGAIDRCRG